MITDSNRIQAKSISIKNNNSNSYSISTKLINSFFVDGNNDILVVDDSLSILKMTTALLKRNGFFFV
jgi:hypothetical protein